MILPIYLFGQEALRKQCVEITAAHPKLNELINNMFETMANADGVGLAAPQIGLNIRLFVIDFEPLVEDNPQYAGFRKVFINAKISEESGELVKLTEGCLSIPGVNEAVERSERIRIRYFDENFEEHNDVFEGFYARCIQHEYDHIEGVLFVDKISAIRKQLTKSKLNNLVKGKSNCHYKVKAVQKH